MMTLDGGNLQRPELAPSDNYLNHTRGLWSWLFTLDHKRIGLMYLVSVLGSFFIGGVMALLVRTQLLVPEGLIMDQDQYNQVFTLHGAIMVFLVIIPSIPAALGNFVLPIMLGAKDVAFPRLNLFSYYLWIVGALFFVLLYLTLMSLSSLPVWREDRLLFLRERADGVYGVDAYFASALLFDVLPMRVLPPFFFGLTTYAMIGLNEGTEVSLVTFPMLPSARVAAKGERPDDTLRELAAVFEAARQEIARNG